MKVFPKEYVLHQYKIFPCLTVLKKDFYKGNILIVFFFAFYFSTSQVV